MKQRLATLLTLFVAVTGVSSCSTYQPLDSEFNIKVEKIDSERANITRANLYKVDEDKVVLRGELQNRFNTRGPILGHLDVELVGLNGKIIKEARIDYMRKSVKSRTANFTVTLPVKADVLSIVRVKHHFVGAAQSDAKPASPWKDVKNEK